MKHIPLLSLTLFVLNFLTFQPILFFNLTFCTLSKIDFYFVTLNVSHSLILNPLCFQFNSFLILLLFCNFFKSHPVIYLNSSNNSRYFKSWIDIFHLKTRFMGTDPRSSLGDFGGMRMGSTLDFETKHRREFRRDNTTNAGIFPIEFNSHAAILQ